jgi:thymidine phosphorylase
VNGLSDDAPFKELIRAKRDGHKLSGAQLGRLARGIAEGGLSDAQVAALAMAIFFQGLDPADELPAFTLAMRDSGRVMNWDGLDKPILDKHSTGGVGDKVSLILAPIVAACGAGVPMLSGRGLGHTGGTLDKLEAIPGYDTAPDPARLRDVVAGPAGCAIIGQTDDLAPADRKMYAIRDATGSVETRSLIVPSILSKKLAAGLHGLVMDVKHGSGAFMESLDDARELAQSLVDVAVAAGLPTVALITDMDAALGHSAGNGVEVQEAIDVLTGHETADERLVEVTLALSEALLALGGLDPAKARPALESGAAADHFARMVHALGGPADLLERPDRYLPRAPVVVEVHAPEPGYVSAHATRDLGLAVLALGGGRTRDGQRIDHAVGLSQIALVGDAVAPGSKPLAVVHARDADAAAAAERSLVAAISVSETAPNGVPVVVERIG